MKKIEVVAAIIYFENKILCVQRPKNKLTYISEKFEFPGGKIESGETKEEALSREIFEELNMAVDIKSFYLKVIHEYRDFEITMHCFKCEADTNAFTLVEHIAYKWLGVEELTGLDWAAADIPIVKKLVGNG